MTESNNIKIIYSLKFLDGLVFFLPILALYFEQSLFTITNVALIFSVRAIAQTVLEVPTGAMADLMGRKKTFIAAQISFLIALVFLSIGGSLTMFFLFALIDGFSRSLKSGTVSSLIFDTLKEEKRDNLFKKVSGTGSAIHHSGVALGSIGLSK